MMIIRLCIILCICFFILCAGLTGCSSNNTEAGISQNPTYEICDSPIANIMDTIEYNKYLKKIWIVKNWDGGAYYYSSFYISKIENGVVEGKFITHSVVEPECYRFRLESSKHLGNLFGIVVNGVAECQFRDKVGNKGNVTFVFKDNNEIEATIAYTDKGKVYEDLSLDGNFVFRPYNLDDIQCLSILEDHSFSVDLDGWRSVNFISGEINTGYKIHPVAYLVNETNDILYEFAASFHVGTMITDAFIKDINMDGLEDVMIVTEFIGAPDSEPLNWVFYQMDDGLFYNSELEEN